MARMSLKSTKGLFGIGVLAVMVVVVAVAMTANQRTIHLTVNEANGKNAPVGKEVLVTGMVSEPSSGDRVKLVSPGATKPSIDVVLAAGYSSKFSFGKGLTTIFSGVLSKPGVLENAKPIRTGPSKRFLANLPR